MAPETQVHRTEAEAVVAPPAPADVLAALTPEEKLAFLHQRVPAVERLGLGAFTTGTEALHGLAWLGEATSFAQPVGMACSWDPRLLAQVGRVVGTEVRAKRVVDPRAGLNVWAPVVNLTRHPLWGRTEEGYSEDPDLTGVLATGYCAGLRGDDPDVWLTVPTLKHYLAYGNEVDRSAASSHLPPQTLREHELPAFRAALQAGVVGAVMPSYNQVNGRPNHVARELLDELRSWTPGSVAVVSDAQAPSSIVEIERYHPDHVSAHAAALRSGVDSYTENADDPRLTIERFTAALEAGLVTWADIDLAVLRVLELRAKTGELSGTDPYRVSADALDAPAHRALAREVARRGVVVLANAEGALPLTTPQVIALVGPFADVTLRDWYSGTLLYGTTLADGVRERYPDAELRVVDGIDRVALRDVSTGRYLAVDTTAGDAAVTAGALTPGSTFALTDWGQDVVTLRSDDTGAFLGGGGAFVRADAQEVDGWVVHELFVIHRHEDGTATFRHRASGRWLRVQRHTGVLVADGEEATATRFDLEVRRDGAAEIEQACAGADTVLVAVGNDPHIAGRETEDRPDLDLPPTARRAFDAAARRSRPVLVVVSSYPYAIEDETSRASAVVWSSHAGQELGHGVLDVLSGDVEPSGRLAQTWWRRVEDAGDLLDYDVVGSGQTYRYNAATPLFAFGHGLSYTQVTHESLELTATDAEAPAVTGAHTPARTPLLADPSLLDDTVLAADEGDPAEVRARITVTNTGPRPVDELVALYVQAPDDVPVPAPRSRLVSWTRVHLAPGERQVVELPVPLGTLAVWDVAARAPHPTGGPEVPGAFVVQPGTYRFVTGAHADDEAAVAVLTVRGPWAPVQDGTLLDASAFHAVSGVVTSDRDREAGACVEVVRDREDGWARYHRVHVGSPVSAVRVRVASRAWPSPQPALVRVEARPAGQEGWTALAAPVEVPAGDPYTWHDVVVPLTGPVAVGDVLDLRLQLGGAARVAEAGLV
ncbi:glycoside hydrolase family 3 C-terminal domain-containing protein [Cellulomonas soli]|uniref:Sugar hydrolase n=1 Tax=Cellulomonas soli TaxID=931535 RepID=A0A512PEK9_9CELL|nr:glycoside hydrolase family 3 C-terminal domain-containing protein [Cellulomonas soli]NYI58860.1 beta-glucosidase [Cellulomonas soli]GEP69644.1 sugar hydrolase [Cellulomonas soli]